MPGVFRLALVAALRGSASDGPGDSPTPHHHPQRRPGNAPAPPRRLPAGLPTPSGAVPTAPGHERAALCTAATRALEADRLAPRPRRRSAALDRTYQTLQAAGGDLRLP